MDSKEVENKILNYDIEIYELEEYLEEDFDCVVTGMINALYVLLKHASRNKEKIEDILEEIDCIVKDDESVRLELIVTLIDNLNKRIDNTYNKSSKNDIIGYRNRLIKIIQKIKDKKEKDKENSVSNIIDKLIYEEKDLIKIEAALKSKKNIEIKKYDELFCNLLEEYLYLTNEEEINYYYKIIIFMLKGPYSKEIIKSKDKYLTILNKANKQNHVSLIINRLNNMSISLEELEQKYDIKFNHSTIITIDDYIASEFKRHDYTYQDVITIDEEGNLCNDDGLFLERNANGSYTLYIHISDVPSLIQKDSYIDLIAYKKAETIYLKDREIAMYPSVLSDDLGSLLEGNVRNVISYVFKLTPDLDVDSDSFTIKRGIIKVGKSLSYHDVDNIIKKNNLDDLSIMLKRLDVMASILKSNNLHKDIYRSAENKTVGIETNSAKASKSSAAKIVQETMVLTNSYVDKYFVKRGYPYIHRIHNEPSIEIDNDLMMLLGIDSDTLQNNQRCARILSAIKDKYLNAEYSQVSSMHYGLGLQYYSHSTSPLRRYADALGQYIIYDILFNCNFDDKTIYKWENIASEVVPYLNERIKNNALFANEYNYLLGKRKIRKK